MYHLHRMPVPSAAGRPAQFAHDAPKRQLQLPLPLCLAFPASAPCPHRSCAPALRGPGDGSAAWPRGQVLRGARPPHAVCPPRPRPHSPAACVGTASSSRAGRRAGARPAPCPQGRGEACAAGFCPRGAGPTSGRPRGAPQGGPGLGRGHRGPARCGRAQPGGAGALPLRSDFPKHGALLGSQPGGPSAVMPVGCVSLPLPAPQLWFQATSPHFGGSGGRGEGSGVALGGLERGCFKFKVSCAVASLNPPPSPKGWEPSVREQEGCSR